MARPKRGGRWISKRMAQHMTRLDQFCRREKPSEPVRPPLAGGILLKRSLGGVLTAATPALQPSR